MPKISEEQRQARREQILAAVWKCFLRKGVHGTSMEDILRESRLSAGAVYLYYTGKDEIILAALSTYLGQLGGLLTPLLSNENPPPPAEFIYEIVSAISKHTHRVGIDLNPVILMGWSEAQTNQKVHAIIREFQTRCRAALVQVAAQWKKQKHIGPDAEPKDVGMALLSLFLGSIAQQALLGGTNPEALTRGVRGMMTVKHKSTKAKRKSSR